MMPSTDKIEPSMRIGDQLLYLGHILVGTYFDIQSRSEVIPFYSHMPEAICHFHQAIELGRKLEKDTSLLEDRVHYLLSLGGEY